MHWIQKCHTHKAPERAFLQLVTIAQKVPLPRRSLEAFLILVRQFPWHQREVYTDKFVARFFKSFEGE